MTSTPASLSVVLVEDSLTIRRQVLQRLMTLPQLRIAGEASDEATALALVTATAPDAVLLDLSLAQGGSGLNVLKALRRQGYRGQAHVLSHQTPDAYRAACVAAGADGFFDKAEELDLLLERLSGAPVPTPSALAAEVFVERLEQSVRLALQEGVEITVQAMAGEGAALESLSAQLALGVDGGDLLGWTEVGGAACLCLAETGDAPEPPLAARLQVLAPEVRIGAAALGSDALSGGGLIALAALRALGRVG